MGAEGRCIPGLVVWLAGSRTPDSHRVVDQGAHGFDPRRYRLSPAAWARHLRKNPAHAGHKTDTTKTLYYHKIVVHWTHPNNEAR